MKYIPGFLIVAIGLFIIYWAVEHSPESLESVITNKLTGSYTMSEPWYYISLVVGSIMALFGIMKIYKASRQA